MLPHSDNVFKTKKSENKIKTFKLKTSSTKIATIKAGAVANLRETFRQPLKENKTKKQHYKNVDIKSVKDNKTS